MSMMFGGIQGMTNTNQQQGQNYNVAMQAARFMRRGGRRGSNNGGLSAQQLADFETMKSNHRINEMRNASEFRQSEVANKAHVADQEYIRAHGAMPNADTGIVPGGHVGAFRNAHATYDQNGDVTGNVAWEAKPSAGGGLRGGGFYAGGPINFGGNPTTAGPTYGTRPGQRTQAPAGGQNDDIIDAEIVEDEPAQPRRAINKTPLQLTTGASPQFGGTTARPTGPAALPVGSQPPGELNDKGYLKRGGGKARKALGTVAKAILPVAEAAGEAVL